MTWERANEYCKDDNAMLACFNTQYERDTLTQHCFDLVQHHGCWVGYKYENGELTKLV